MRLDERHHRAAEVLNRGGTQKEAGLAAGVSQHTISQWLSNLPEFRALASDRRLAGRPPRSSERSEYLGPITRTVVASLHMIDVDVVGEDYRHRSGDPRWFCIWCATQQGARHIPGCRRAA